MRRHRALIAIALLLGLAGLAVFPAAPPSLAARSGSALPSSSSTSVYGLGTVEARILSRIGFDLGGTVAELSADHGDRITQGQVLARLDSREQVAKVAQAEAGYRQAQAAVVQAQARLERARAVQAQRRNVNHRRQSLVRNGTVSVETAEDAQSNADVAAADVAVAASDLEAARGALQAAQAALQLARATLDKHVLAAPYDGVVVERSRELGTALPAGTPLFVVADPATFWVQAFVDESRAGPLRLGQGAAIALRSLPGQRFRGRVIRIHMESDRISEERRVGIAFDELPADLYLGEQAEVFIETAIPRTAGGAP